MGVASVTIVHRPTAMQIHRNQGVTELTPRKKPTDCEVAYHAPLHKLWPVSFKSRRETQALPWYREM